MRFLLPTGWGLYFIYANRLPIFFPPLTDTYLSLCLSLPIWTLHPKHNIGIFNNIRHLYIPLGYPTSLSTSLWRFNFSNFTPFTSLITIPLLKYLCIAYWLIVSNFAFTLRRVHMSCIPPLDYPFPRFITFFPFIHLCADTQVSDSMSVSHHLFIEYLCARHCTVLHVHTWPLDCSSIQRNIKCLNELLLVSKRPQSRRDTLGIHGSLLETFSWKSDV